MKKYVYLALILLLTACGGPVETPVYVSVVDQESQQGLDSAQVFLSRSLEGREEIIDSFRTDMEGQLSFAFEAQPGYTYALRTQRRHYEAAVSQDGAQYNNQASVLPNDTNRVQLSLLEILPPDPEKYVRMHADVSVNEVIAALRDTAWSWTFLPRLQWEDIPALLEIAADTNLIDPYPRHPLSRYRPPNARVGLVALWMIEAIRKMENQSSEVAGALMPPSRAPILGTRKGNPSGYNSPEQMETARMAYQDWWDSQAEPEADARKIARKNPLVGKGLSWM
ncbi:MAG: DUF4943 family protein [Bacteroidota bacterium]